MQFPFSVVKQVPWASIVGLLHVLLYVGDAATTRKNASDDTVLQVCPLACESEGEKTEVWCREKHHNAASGVEHRTLLISEKRVETISCVNATSAMGRSC
jgi:hypothetical protein